MDPTQIDPELIYAKTASGEEAMQQRTRVVQRNVRMVLILVDGNATVAELCNRTGNAQLTQNALFELENDGFIERRTEKNSVWVRSGKPGRQAAPPPNRRPGSPVLVATMNPPWSSQCPRARGRGSSAQARSRSHHLHRRAILL